MFSRTSESKLIVPPVSASSPSTSTSPVPRANGELILVADDQDNVRKLLEIILGNHGFKTVSAADGTQAVSILAARGAEISAVITDVHMPNTGNEPIGPALRRARPGMPILFISGMASDANSEHAKDPFLLKPFRPASLVEAVHRLLHPPKT